MTDYTNAIRQGVYLAVSDYLQGSRPSAGELIQRFVADPKALSDRLEHQNSDLEALLELVVKKHVQGVEASNAISSANAHGRAASARLLPGGATMPPPAKNEPTGSPAEIPPGLPPSPSPVMQLYTVASTALYGPSECSAQQYVHVNLTGPSKVTLKFYWNSSVIETAHQWQRLFAKFLRLLELDEIQDTNEMHGKTVLIVIGAKGIYSGLDSVADVLGLEA